MDDSIIEIEIDTDGVLADMDGSYTEYICDLIPDFSEDKYIKEWGMPSVAKEYPEAYSRICELWCNPTFISNLPRYPRVLEGLILLYASVKDIANIIVHTHILNTIVYDSRYQWLNELRNETNVNFDIEISTGVSKSTRNTSKYIIEDNVSNLQKSTADYKFLIRRGCNRSYVASDLGCCKQAFVCKDFFESVCVLINLLRGEKYDEK